MPVENNPAASFPPSSAPAPAAAPAPSSAPAAPAQDQGNTLAAQQFLAQQLLALMAALMTAAQSPSAPNLAHVQSAAKDVMAALPQGQSPQWLATVADLADAPALSAGQVQSAASTLQLSQLNILPQTDPHAAGNRHHHPKGRHRPMV